MFACKSHLFQFVYKISRISKEFQLFWISTLTSDDSHIRPLNIVCEMILFTLVPTFQRSSHFFSRAIKLNQLLNTYFWYFISLNENINLFETWAHWNSSVVTKFGPLFPTWKFSFQRNSDANWFQCALKHSNSIENEIVRQNKNQTPTKFSAKNVDARIQYIWIFFCVLQERLSIL